MNRRDFIQVMLPVAGLPVAWPMWSHSRSLSSRGTAGRPRGFPDDRRVLVLVQLAGGNDGLNTIVPYGHDAYYRQRPQLAIPRREVIPLNDEIGFNDALAAVQPIFDAGDFAAIQGVGYPDPDRSHFRSTDIWLTGSGSDDLQSTGWLGRYFDQVCPDGEECGTTGPPAIQIGLNSSLALFGRNQKGITLQNPLQFYRLVSSQADGHMAEIRIEPSRPAERELQFLRGHVGRCVPLRRRDRTGLREQTKPRRLPQQLARPATGHRRPHDRGRTRHPRLHRVDAGFRHPRAAGRYPPQSTGRAGWRHRRLFRRIWKTSGRPIALWGSAFRNSAGG